MMQDNKIADCYLHNNKVNTFFQLLGEKENDITYGFGWILSNSKTLVELLFKKLKVKDSFENYYILLQKYETKNKKISITDIEIVADKTHIIVEAKKGWNLPSKEQLQKYADKKSFEGKKRIIVSCSECSEKYAKYYLPNISCELKHLSWKTIFQLVCRARQKCRQNKEKRLLDEYSSYLKGIMTMQNKESNWVYVVSISTKIPAGWGISWIDIIREKGKYFHPISGNGWPNTPPNYIAFRYCGKLQSIHHIESYVVTEYVNDEVPEIPKEQWLPHFVYKLGPAISPKREVKTGNIYRNGRVRCMFDTLFTSETISEARDKSHQRMNYD